MPAIVPIIEGEGDRDAIPMLARRILHEIFNEFTWEIKSPKKAHSIPILRKKVESYLSYALFEEDCAGILIVLDLDDGCPEQEACNFAHAIRDLQPRVPVAVVFAHREFECWLLSDLESLAGRYDLPEDVTSPDNVESIRGAKEWISRQMPYGKMYKETIHQAAMSSFIRLDRVMERSRSFRRLVHSIEQIIGWQNLENARAPYVTPDRCEKI
jgi:hypothetical protein